MAKCKHENRDHLFAGDRWARYIAAEDRDWLSEPVKCEQLRCLDCGAWLSLGPSNDDSSRVRDEIRAARLIASYEDASDTDDDIADPVVRRVIEHWLGFSNLPRYAEQVVHLYTQAVPAGMDDQQ